VKEQVELVEEEHAKAEEDCDGERRDNDYPLEPPVVFLYERIEVHACSR
jgi:hypothetical protein